MEVKKEKIEKNNIERQLKNIAKIKFDLREYLKIKKEVKIFYDKYQSSMNFFNKKKDEIGVIKLKNEKIEGEKKLIVREIKNYNEKIIELKESKKQMEKERKHVHYLTILGEIMYSFRTHLISRIRPVLSEYASEFYRSLTDGKYQEIEVDENYNLKVYDNGKFYEINRFSGGEEDLANLCLRLAISEVIIERAGSIFNFIILDEIFGSQDMLRRHNIIKTLNSLSSKFRQIFLITHIEDVKNYMENIIFVSETENNISNAKIK
jgi:exonuclease SbcC